MGKPAARVGDLHLCPMITPGVPPIPHVGGPILPPGVLTVLIGSKPAATITSKCTCIGPPDTIIQGVTSVLIGNKPAATLGSSTTHGGKIILGCFTVLIGNNTHHSQEQTNSCVVASSRNMIEDMTGEDIDEKTLRDEMRNIMGNPSHNFVTNGTNPIHATRLLASHGVANTTETGVSLDRLETLTKHDPVLVGFPGHRVMLETVTRDAAGNRTFVVRDPGSTFGGQPRQMTEAQFQAAYNSRAIVIIPAKCSC